MANAEVQIKFKPRGDSIRITAILGSAKVAFQFDPEDEDSTEALELLVGNAGSILERAISAANAQVEGDDRG